VSYADKEHGHQGTIYKASNFTQLEDIPGERVIMYRGKQYHDKTIRTKYKGELKPFARRIKDALETGEAFYKNTAGKCTYIYKLRNITTAELTVNMHVCAECERAAGGRKGGAM